jgi:hypothetical protein
MTEHRRAVDTVTPNKAASPIDRLGHVLKAEGELPVIPDVRLSDLEPYVGLRYLSKRVRLLAIILVLLLIAEVITGFVAQGSAALPTLLGEASRLVVAAGLLWGAGDFAILLIDVGHDVRAARILLGRQAAHHIQEHHREMKKHAASEHLPDRVTDHRSGPRA